MKTIGLLSDTHGYLHPSFSVFFQGCDEIWHAGDIGDLSVIRKLSEICPVRAVYGNIDGTEAREDHPEIQIFQCEEMRVGMVHIGGYPGNYSPQARKLIQREQLKIFISGHSHILKVMYDQNNSLLHLNPGAAGINGWHQVITMMRFKIDGDQVKDMEIKEIERK